MKMFDINGDFVNVDVRPSSYPVKGISKSKLQGEIGQKLQNDYPREIVLEEFIIPGSRMAFDFFLPRKKIVIECDGSQHFEFSPFFHGDRETSHKFAKQIGRDRAKEEWAEINNIKVIRISSKEEMEKINGLFG